MAVGTSWADSLAIATMDDRDLRSCYAAFGQRIARVVMPVLDEREPWGPLFPFFVSGLK